MREGINAVADRIAHLAYRQKIGAELETLIEAGDLSGALKAANAWYAKKRNPLSAIVYTTLLLFRDLDREARGVLQQIDVPHTSLDLIAIELDLLSGDVDAALAALEQVMSRDVDAGQATFIADLLLDTGDDEAYAKWIEEALQRGGTVHAARAAYRLRSTDPLSAAEALQIAGRLAPTDQELWLSIARAWHEAGAATEAVNAYERAQKIGVDFYTIGNEYAEALFESGDLIGCKKVLGRLREYDPDDTSAMRLLAIVLFEQSDFERSRIVWNELVALENDPDDITFCAECARQLGDIAMELKILGDGYEAHPELVSAYARALIRAGRNDQAIEKLKSADPDDIDVRIAYAIATIREDEPIETESFDEADYLELLEVALLAGAREKVAKLRADVTPDRYAAWFVLIDALIDREVDTIELPEGVVPIWETESLERLGEALPESSNFLQALAACEARMQPLREMKF